MSSAKFSLFLTQLAQSLREEKGPELAYLLKPTSEHGKGLVKDFRSNVTVRHSAAATTLTSLTRALETITIPLRRLPRKSLG